MKRILSALVLVLVAIVAIAAVRAPVISSTKVQILYGTSTTATDRTVTNTFSQNFSTVPIIVVTGSSNDAPHINTAATVSNVIFGASASSASIKWIAIGAP